MQTFITRQDRDITDILSNSPIPAYRDRRSVGEGITASTRCDIGTRHAIVKTSQASFEVAAYKVSTLFPQLVRVPVTVLRPDPDSTGTVSVQDWHHGATFLPMRGWHALYGGITRSDVVGIATFDYLIANTDRHPHNFMRDGATLIAIDHGFSFAANAAASDPLGHLRGARVPAYVKSHICRLLDAQADARTLLAPYLTDSQTDRLIGRAEDIVAARTFRDIAPRW